MKNLKNTRIEFHILQSFPVTCLNRDDVGAPKTPPRTWRRPQKQGKKLSEWRNTSTYVEKTIAASNAI